MSEALPRFSHRLVSVLVIPPTRECPGDDVAMQGQSSEPRGWRIFGTIRPTFCNGGNGMGSELVRCEGTGPVLAETVSDFVT